MEDVFKRQHGESDEDCIYRICALKDELGYTWPDMAEILNRVLQKDFSDSKYRKDYAAFQKYGYGKNIASFTVSQAPNDSCLCKNNEQAQADELYKLKKQCQDQRREYNKLLARDARYEHLTGMLVEAASRLSTEKALVSDGSCYIESGNDAVLCLTDWHYGMVTDNIWNTYNIQVCKDRVSKLLNRCKCYLRLHNVDKLHILLLGDFIHGAIHTGVRVASEENACEQLMHVSELLAEFINELSQYVNAVDVYSTYGNHARTIQNKKDSCHSDNMERVIPWWLQQRLKDNNKVHINSESIYEFIYLNVYGHDIVGVHGDLENFKKLGVDMHTLFSKQYGLNIEYVFSGDKHHMDSTDNYGIENVLIRSLCGSDEHANNKRLYSKAGQTLCIFNQEDGKVCTYNITF